MQVPTVSVLMPTYNRARLLPEAIASVLAQEVTDFELLVLDDGSTDDTAEVVATIEDPRLRYIACPHRGISMTLNAGLDRARGTYVARLDSDDTWHPELLSVLLPVLEADSQLGFVYGRGRAMNEDGAPLPHVQGIPPRYPRAPLESLLFDDCTCNVALLARREVIVEAGRFDESLTANEDWDMWLRVALRHPFRFVDRELASIRWHRDNLTGLNSAALEDVLASRRTPLDKIFEHPDLAPEVHAMKAEAYTNVALFTGQRWLHAGHWRRAAAAFGDAISTSGRPLHTFSRGLWLSLIVPKLRKTSAGDRLIQSFARFRRRRRQPGESP